MKLSKFDIGADVISIITKGMYPDPRDAIREYIQNAVDASAKDVSVKVRSNSIVIQDNGAGMNYNKLRKAVRVGISDKNPSSNVGFMGIGIYSAFHLCNNLVIYSRGSKNIPNRLQMDFGSMKSTLREQKEMRIKENIESEQLLDLQSLLEKYITITEDGELQDNEFPTRGTRIELMDLDSSFSSVLSDFDELANYLREVIPLKFNDENIFSWGPHIENQIREICIEHGASFEIVNLSLQINARTETLFRPYKNSDFSSKKEPQKPFFCEIKKGNIFFGVAWGCLNGIRKVVDTKNLRGFILKKQGFSIGRRENLIKYFPRGRTFFERYIGEVIIVKPDILPNAARNDLEFSGLRTEFYEAFAEVADQFDLNAKEFQEWTKADEELGIIRDNLKRLNGLYNTVGDNTEKLLDLVVETRNLHENIEGRIKRRALRPGSESDAKQIKEQADELEKLIQEKITALVEHKKVANRNKQQAINIAKSLTKIILPKTEFINYESLIDMLEDIDIIIQDKKLIETLEAIDEKLIIESAETKKDYYKILHELQIEILNRTEQL